MPKMPSKRVKRTKQTEQKKIVTSTLLSLSLQFDNHICAKKIISLQQAKDYIREISELKIESDDARSLGVSEKLTSMLEVLIKEYTNSENSNTFSLNNNVEKKLNENFESKSNEGLNIRPQSCEGSVMVTNADHSQNILIESNNIEDRININNNISIPIDNMSKNFPKEGMSVENNNYNSANVNHYKALIIENFNTNGLPCIMGKEKINKSNLKDINNEPSAMNNKTAFTNDTKVIADTECDNRIIPKDNVKKLPKTKKTNSKKKAKNNLTWIENIKFIREIDRDEHLVNNLEETFWSDLTKPANCSTDFTTD